MHYFIGVILPLRYDMPKLEEAIGEILKPWDENGPDGKYNPSGTWDWWQLGGRWTGVWADDYEPGKDPLNVDPHTGQAAWPSQWRKRPDLDVISVAEFIVGDKRMPYAIYMAPDVMISKETWNGDVWVKHPDYDERAMQLLTENRDMFIAAVDIHS